MRQEIHWCGVDRTVKAVTTQPSRVWAIPGSVAPPLPMTPQHGRNAWSLDVGHDWKMWRGCLRYSPGGGDHKGAWLLCEWDEPAKGGA